MFEHPLLTGYHHQVVFEVCMLIWLVCCPQRRNVESFCYHQPLYSMARTHFPSRFQGKDMHSSTIQTLDITFWSPEDITRDRGAPFTSSQWAELGQVLGVQLHTTNLYHPQANGMIERLHRQLKSSLKARTTNPYWMDHLSLVLLGIRVVLREEVRCSAEELVYGFSFCLPGEFVDHKNSPNIQPSKDFLRLLQRPMRTSLLTPANHH